MFGIAILQIHDIADVCVAMFKAYSEIEKRSSTLLYLFAANMELVWFYTRLYLFPTRILFPTLEVYNTMVGPAWEITKYAYAY